MVCFGSRDSLWLCASSWASQSNAYRTRIRQKSSREHQAELTTGRVLRFLTAELIARLCAYSTSPRACLSSVNFRPRAGRMISRNPTWAGPAPHERNSVCLVRGILLRWSQGKSKAKREYVAPDWWYPKYDGFCSRHPRGHWESPKFRDTTRRIPTDIPNRCGWRCLLVVTAKPLGSISHYFQPKNACFP